MAISPDIESGPFIGNGAQTAFPFSFTAITPAEVAVELDGVAQPAGFTVTLADVGGTVTFASPPAAGALVMLRSSPDYLQDSVFENEGAYNLATVNTINRRQTVRALVTADQARRAIKAPGGDVADMTLPSAADRADRLLGFGAIDNGAVPAAFDLSAAALETLAAASEDITTLADHIGSIDAVAADLSGANGIGTVASNIADVDVVAANAAAVAAVAAISAGVSQVAGDHAALVAVANDLANIDAVAGNLAAVNAMVAAAATLGVFPNSAHVGGNIPRGAISFSFTAGSGGTNSINNVATFTGGTLTCNPQILYDVVGGAVSNVRMLFGGLYIGASTPTMPTVVLANGGTGTITLAGGRYYAVGQGYWATSADGRTLDRIVNVANAPALDATVPSVATGAVVAELQNAGGRKNLWPDPFHLELNLAANGGFRTGLPCASTPFTFGASAPTWVYSSASTQSPYPDGKMLIRPSTNVATPVIQIYLDRLALQAGDVIEFSQEMAYSTNVSSATGQVGTYAFYDGSGAIIGSAANLFLLSAGAGALNNTPKRFTTGAITVPAGARFLKFSYTLWGTGAIEIYSTWMHKGSTLSKPLADQGIPDGPSRIRKLEDRDATANNILLKQFAYASLATVIAPSGFAFNTSSGLTSMASNFVTASIPAGGFNAIQQIFNWNVASTGPARIYCQVRTAVGGSNAINGKLIAEGWIGSDPNALTTGLQSVLLYDAITGLPRTIQATDADMLGTYAVIYFGVKSDGSYASGMWVNYATVPDGDATFPGYYQMGVPVGEGSGGLISSSASQYLAANRVLLTTPTVVYVPSATFAGNVAANFDQVPSLDMLPQRIWNVVNMETWIYYAGMQHRPASRTNFYSNFAFTGSYPTNLSGTFEEGVCISETSAGTKTLTISASIGSQVYSTKTTSVKTAANTAGAGTTARILGLGSSLMQNAGLQSNLLQLVADTTINPGGAATGLNIVNVGTVGSAPNLNEGRSGQSIGIYFSAGDKFYNAGDFDFANYVTTYLAGVPPTHVVLGDPFWSVASAVTDGAAALGAASCVSLIERMITNIAAYNTANGTSVKTLIWFPPIQPEFGQDGEPRSLTTISQHQRNRNLKEAAKLFAATYTTAREANLVYACGFNVVGNPEVTPRRAWAPRGPGARALVSTTHGPYADYATMAAAANVINDGEIIQVGTPTAVSYWVKQGSGASGGFRSVSEIDGFVRRIVDSTHGCPYREIAQQVFACIKNNP